jgi:hypothetical protein
VESSGLAEGDGARGASQKNDRPAVPDEQGWRHAQHGVAVRVRCALRDDDRDIDRFIGEEPVARETGCG